VPHADKLLTIKGSELVSAVVIVREIDNIHLFRDPRQILKMAGFSHKENSSGKHKGKTTISRNLTRPMNPLRKMQSIIALCGKLTRSLYAILSKGSDYKADKLIDDMKRFIEDAA